VRYKGQRSRSLGTKNIVFRAYIRQNWIDLRQTKTVMITGPFYTYLRIHYFRQRKWIACRSGHSVRAGLSVPSECPDVKNYSNWVCTHDDYFQYTVWRHYTRLHRVKSIPSWQLITRKLCYRKDDRGRITYIVLVQT